MTQRFAAALGHDFDRQATVEIGRAGLPVVEGSLVAGEQRVDESVVLLAREWAIDVIGAGAAGPGLVIARLEPGLIEIDRVAMHDRGDGVEKGELFLAG